jgi:hypothetical protein
LRGGVVFRHSLSELVDKSQSDGAFLNVDAPLALGNGRRVECRAIVKIGHQFVGNGVTEALKLQDALPEVSALSLAGILAKLEVIVGADRDIGDPTDFPWPHIASVLRDLKAIAGDLPPYESDRSTTRADVARHLKHIRQTVKSFAETSVFPKPAEF